MLGLRGKLRLALVVTGVVLAGCRDVAGPSPIFSPQVALYSVLQPDSTLVRVVADQLDASGLRLPLSGGVAVVGSLGGSATLAEASDSLPGCFVTATGSAGVGTEGCYAGLLPQPPGPGQVITLDFALVAGGSVTGSLVLPAVPVATIPADSQRVTVGYQGESGVDPYPIAYVPIVLDSAPFAASVEATAGVVRAFPRGGQGATMDPRRCHVRSAMTPFTAPALQGVRDFLLHDVLCSLAGALVLWDSVDLSIHVTSMDVNYSRYVRDVLENPALAANRAGFGVEGAVGVFGAVATTTLPLRVIYQP